MTGILLLLVMAAWLAIVIWLRKIIIGRLPASRWRTPAGVALFVLLLPLPVIDEIVGGWQFFQLCKENSTIQVDRAKAAGKTVYPARTPDVEVRGTWVRVVIQPRRLVDATTGEILISYNGLIAGGGQFIRLLGISEGDVPLTFRGWCKPGDQYTLENVVRELGMTLVRRPEAQN